MEFYRYCFCLCPSTPGPSPWHACPVGGISYFSIWCNPPESPGHLVASPSFCHSFQAAKTSVFMLNRLGCGWQLITSFFWRRALSAFHYCTFLVMSPKMTSTNNIKQENLARPGPSSHWTEWGTQYTKPYCVAWVRLGIGQSGFWGIVVKWYKIRVQQVWVALVGPRSRPDHSSWGVSTQLGSAALVNCSSLQLGSLERPGFLIACSEWLTSKGLHTHAKVCLSFPKCLGWHVSLPL